jgi:gluconate 5-dehydrogenase
VARPTALRPRGPDLVKRDFGATAPTQRWVADITVQTWEGWLFPAAGDEWFRRRRAWQPELSPRASGRRARTLSPTDKVAAARFGGRSGSGRGARTDPFDIVGKHAVVIGAGGLGRVIALGLAHHGAHIAVADLDAGRAEAVAAEARTPGAEALALAVDIADEESARHAADEVLRSFPRVDVLVNAAGITVRKRAEDVSVEEWRRILDVNTTGTFICCQVFGAHMARLGGGSIINLSSVRGRYGAKFGRTEYSASKGAVDSMTRSLAAQWAEFGIRVNAIAPTFVETDLTRSVLADERFAAGLRESIPMGRWAEAEDLVGPVLFFASPASGFVTGQILFVDGGLTARI